MATIRVPYPADPQGRRDVFERVVAKLTPFGTCEGSPDAGTLSGSTPVGKFAGSYRSEPGSDVLEITLTKKPWLVPSSLIEHEVRRQMAQT
jgi:hypothetical protein